MTGDGAMTDREAAWTPEVRELLRAHADLCREVAGIILAEPDPIRRASWAWFANHYLDR